MERSCAKGEQGHPLITIVPVLAVIAVPPPPASTHGQGCLEVGRAKKDATTSSSQQSVQSVLSRIFQGSSILEGSSFLIVAGSIFLIKAAVLLVPPLEIVRGEAIKQPDVRAGLASYDHVGE